MSSVLSSPPSGNYAKNGDGIHDRYVIPRHRSRKPLALLLAILADMRAEAQHADNQAAYDVADHLRRHGHPELS